MIDEQLIRYMDQIQPPRSERYSRMEELAARDHVPIINPHTGYFIQMLCMAIRPKRILEIGTAIGYSGMWMLDHSDATLDTIDIDGERLQMAMALFADMGVSERVRIHHGDANQILPSLVGGQLFDLVFLDAAKGQYMNFFQHVDKLTDSRAVVITDNVFFHGMVAGIEQPPKRLAPLVRKVDAYNRMLQEHPDWHTTFHSIGDGLAVSIKR